MSNEAIQIKLAEESDLESMVRLNRQFHLNIPGFRWDGDSYISNELKENNYWVIKDEKGIIAAMCLKMLENEGSIETIAISPEKHKLGFGRRLIEFAKDFSKQMGKSRLSVESFCEYNLQEFYEKCGFTKEPNVRDYNGHPYDCFHMTI